MLARRTRDTRLRLGKTNHTASVGRLHASLLMPFKSLAAAATVTIEPR
jgi:hypothetical protein